MRVVRLSVWHLSPTRRVRYWNSKIQIIFLESKLGFCGLRELSQNDVESLSAMMSTLPDEPTSASLGSPWMVDFANHGSVGISPQYLAAVYHQVEDWLAVRGEGVWPNCNCNGRSSHWRVPFKSPSPLSTLIFLFVQRNASVRGWTLLGNTKSQVSQY